MEKIVSFLLFSLVYVFAGVANSQEQISHPVSDQSLVGRWAGHWENIGSQSTGGAVVEIRSVDTTGIFQGVYFYYGPTPGSCLLYGRGSSDGKRFFFSSGFAPDKQKRSAACSSMEFNLLSPDSLSGRFVNLDILIKVSK